MIIDAVINQCFEVAVAGYIFREALTGDIKAIMAYVLFLAYLSKHIRAYTF
jgi:hypothetical protein